MRTTAALAAGLIGLAGPAMAGDEIVREGAGERRSELNDLELTAFDAGLIEGLDGWLNTEPITADQLDGKVVVLFTWASWYPTSLRALPVAQRVSERFADDGVVVIGVHNPEEYAGAEQAIARRHVTFPIAHDADGKLREALLVDQDPDFYLIDRAGHLRFADIETGSVPAAVEQLVGESPEKAKALPQRLAQEARQARIESRRGRHVSEEYVKALRSEIPFVLPGPEAYGKVEWPEDDEDGYRGNIGAEDYIGKPFPAAQALSSAPWLGDEPETKGRVVVVTFWNPGDDPSRRALPKLEAIQDTDKANLVVIGLAVSEDQTDAKIRSFLGDRERSVYFAYDENGAMAESMSVRTLPHAMVLSSDGVVRWQGDPNDAGFDGVVDRLIDLDPGVKARMAAREAYLKKLRDQD